MAKTAEKSNVGPWIVVGVGVVGVVGLFYLLTRPAAASTGGAPAPQPGTPQPTPTTPLVLLPGVTASNPGNYATSYGTAYHPPADYQITLTSPPGNTAVPMKVGQILAIAPPDNDSVWTWQTVAIGPANLGLFTAPDAATQDLGWVDGTERVRPTAVGTSVVTMSRFRSDNGVSETYTVTITAS
jgi:hypothetical protein